ncbi:MAG: GNAT family N-acetyltransferase [Gammaproteobacteria bacterium]|nr:GNAT family N-acetyltransferase [Gammaproteobacteria bacterium]
MQEPITLRPVCADDEIFLFGLFCIVHEHTLANADISAEQSKQLLRMQFTAQQSQYHSSFANADFDLVLRNAVPVGSLYALRGPDEFVLIDITLLPEHRNCGIGAQLVKGLIRQANVAEKTLEAHVRISNPAWRLWKRLGFQRHSDDGVYMRIRVPSDYERSGPRS